MLSIPNQCSIENCEKPASKRSWCVMHYTRWRTHGDPLATKYNRSIVGITQLPEYKVWINIKDRCQRVGANGYANYGGRGITICPQWDKSFTSFLKDVGQRPSPRHEIERIDNNGNYEPGNCRWATHQEQSNNRRSNRFFTIGDETKTLKQWSDERGLKYKSVHARIQRGISIEDALH